MNLPKIILLAVYAVSLLCSIATVGKERKPVTPGGAVVITIVTAALATAAPSTMTPLCWRCLIQGKIARHRHCPRCGRLVTGSDEKYVAHAWNCPGPRLGQ